ncbi:SidA/IucD/PvdA family monooxygenase [Azospirillum brasilense]|uniref:FAD/NAD(P)-binding protein n=1 Tax=Azospirillum argentinense TaxID=2970906 RepID=UPI00190EDAA9|nr:NAD(P)/FAD-dependent oxidoreductase [Azospirillum argentinense]MBK3801102.1 SidA/IucD/PvdA family monooxygenase [Azospirillum argentinense]
MTIDTVAVDALAADVARALDRLGEDGGNWVPPSPGIDHDVAVVGAGQSGLAVAFALRRAGIANITVIDAAEEGREGVWESTARMQTLRSVKTLPGPELGLPGLTFRSWYEAAFGADAYAVLGRIPRTVWADYVRWYRHATGVAVRNRTRLTSIEPLDATAPRGFRLRLERDGESRTETARKLVLATGMDGSGGPFVPPVIADSLPRSLYAHTDDPIDFAALGGKVIGVLGAASSAFDTAATALEQGAAAVHLFCRNADLTRVTTVKGLSYAGALDHFHELPDADRWSLMRRFFANAPGPMPDTVRRATRFPNFHLHLAAGWTAARDTGGTVEVEAADGRHSFDFVIAGTGYRADLARRPELAGFADAIALWRDRYSPPPGEEDAALAANPYLGPGFEFVGKVPGTAPFLKDIHNFTYGGVVSHGRAVGEIASLKHGVPRLVSAIGRDLWLADRAAHLKRLSSFDTPDLTGEEYVHALWRPPVGSPPFRNTETPT